MADERFGRIVLQTDLNEVYTLDLYEAEGIVCRGFYLPLPEPPLPAGIPSEVEFAAPADVWSLLKESLWEFESDDVRSYQLADPSVSNYRFYVDMARVRNAEQYEAEVWTGSLRGYGGDFTFVLERYGSPELAAVLIIIAIMLFFDLRASEHSAECYRQAVEACGEGRVKRYRTRSTLVSLQDMSFSYNCAWECK